MALRAVVDICVHRRTRHRDLREFFRTLANSKVFTAGTFLEGISTVVGAMAQAATLIEFTHAVRLDEFNAF